MLQKIKDFINSYGTLTILFLCMITFIRTCSITTSVKNVERKVDNISLNSVLTKEQVDSVVKNRLYEFLIFEEDLDRGKTSLSDIRIKISGNEK